VELQTLWSAEPLDAEAIAAKEAELAKVRVKMVEVRQELQKEAEGVLTEEQLEKIKIRPPEPDEPWRPPWWRYGHVAERFLLVTAFTRV